MNQALTKSFILITVILMDVLTGMEFDLFVPSFPELQNHFGLSAFWVEASLSANFIGYCLGLFLVGDLADRYGRKSIILFGLGIFVFGSVFCLWAVSYKIFLTGRFLQGIGIAAPAILSFLIIADLYSLKKQQFLMAMLNGSMNISVAAAPVIGSYITKYFHWQGNFIALLFLGVTTLVMTVFFIPAYKLQKNKEALSLHGYIKIFQSKNLMLLIVCLMFVFVPYWIFAGMSPLLYMKGLGVSLSHFGYYQGVLALVFAIGSLLSGLIINKYSQKSLLNVSNLIFIASLISITLVTVFNSASPLLITLAFIPFIIGQIFPSNLLYPLSLNLMPYAKGRVSAILQGGRLILASLSLQMAGYFYQGTFTNIGIIITCFIVIAVILLFFVIKNPALQANSIPSTANPD